MILFGLMFLLRSSLNVKHSSVGVSSRLTFEKLNCVASRSYSVISSQQNEKIKQMRSLENVKGRENSGLIRLEGHRQIIDALKNGFIPTNIFFTPRAVDIQNNSMKKEFVELLEKIDDQKIIHEVNEKIINSISDTVQNQGLIASFQKPTQNSLENLVFENDTKKSIFLLLDNISDPGNLGSLIRSSVAFGIDKLIVIDGCDIWSPKTIRSSMGLILSIPIIETNCNDFSKYFTVHDIFRKFNFLLADGTTSSRSKNYFDCDFTSNTVIVIGSEAFGLSKTTRELLDSKDNYIKIPMYQNVESLNAAVAGSIILCEAARQRRNTRN